MRPPRRRVRRPKPVGVSIWWSIPDALSGTDTTEFTLRSLVVAAPGAQPDPERSTDGTRLSLWVEESAGHRYEESDMSCLCAKKRAGGSDVTSRTIASSRLSGTSGREPVRDRGLGQRRAIAPGSRAHRLARRVPRRASGDPVRGPLIATSRPARAGSAQRHRLGPPLPAAVALASASSASRRRIARSSAAVSRSSAVAPQGLVPFPLNSQASVSPIRSRRCAR